MAKQINNYFTNMISRYSTEDFVHFLKPEQIQRSAKERIFREMLRGQIDFSVHGKYFQDSKFLENLIIAATDELNNNIAINAALEFYDMNRPGDMIIIRNRVKHSNLVVIYNAIVIRLNNVKFTGNIGYLTDLPYVLKDEIKYI